MEEGYEQPPSSNGDGPWWEQPREASGGEGIVIAFLAVAMFLITGGVLWGLLAVMPSWVQIVGVIAALPGTVMLARACGAGVRVVAGRRSAVGDAWRRLVHGSGLMGVALVVVAVPVLIVISSR